MTVGGPCFAAEAEVRECWQMMSLPTPTDELTNVIPKSPTAELERLSIAFVNIVNERDFDFASKSAQELVTRLTPEWKASMDTSVSGLAPVTFAEQIARWRERASENPDVHFQIMDVFSVVDEVKGVASVYLEMEVDGVSNVKLQAMNELKWRLVEDVWMCYYVIGMRGSKMNNGLDP